MKKMILSAGILATVAVGGLATVGQTALAVSAARTAVAFTRPCVTDDQSNCTFRSSDVDVAATYVRPLPGIYLTILH